MHTPSIAQGNNLLVSGTKISTPVILPDRHHESQLTTQGDTEHNMQETSLLVNGISISAPLSLNGGGDTSFESGTGQLGKSG